MAFTSYRATSTGAGVSLGAPRRRGHANIHIGIVKTPESPRAAPTTPTSDALLCLLPSVIELVFLWFLIAPATILITRRTVGGRVWASQIYAKV